jgi:hypothetical protein
LAGFNAFAGLRAFAGRNAFAGFRALAGLRAFAGFRALAGFNAFAGFRACAGFRAFAGTILLATTEFAARVTDEFNLLALELADLFTSDFLTIAIFSCSSKLKFDSPTYAFAYCIQRAKLFLSFANFANC